MWLYSHKEQDNILFRFILYTLWGEDIYYIKFCLEEIKFRKLQCYQHSQKLKINHIYINLSNWIILYNNSDIELSLIYCITYRSSLTIKVIWADIPLLYHPKTNVYFIDFRLVKIERRPEIKSQQHSKLLYYFVRSSQI